MHDDTKPSQVVIEAIRQAYPSDSDKILESLKYDFLMGCFYFYWCGMYVGVEQDGYIHT